MDYQSMARVALDEAWKRLYGQEHQIPDDPVALSEADAHKLSRVLAESVNRLLVLRENTGQAVLALLWEAYKNAVYMYGGLVNEAAEYNTLTEWAEDNVLAGNQWYVRDMALVVERIFAELRAAQMRGKPYRVDEENKRVTTSRNGDLTVITPEMLIGKKGMIKRLKGASSHFAKHPERREKILEHLLFSKSSELALREIREMDGKKGPRITTRIVNGKYNISISGLEPYEAERIERFVKEVTNAVIANN